MSENHVNPNSNNPPGPIDAKLRHGGDLPADQGKEAPPKQYDDGGRGDLADTTAEYRIPGGMPGTVAEGLGKAPLTKEERQQLRELQERAGMPLDNLQNLAPTKESAPRPSRRGFLKLLGWGTVGAVGVGGGVAAVVASRGGKPTAVAPAPSPAPTPTPTQSAAEPSSTPEVVVNPAEAEANLIEERWSNKVSSTDFNKLERKERLAVVASVYYQIANAGYHKFFGREKDQVFPGGLHLYDFNPLDPVHGADELNNGQMIVDQMLFAEQAVKAQSVNGDIGEIGDELDKERARKMISGLSYYTDQDKHPELTANTYDLHEHFTGPQEKSSHLSAASRRIASATSSRPKTGRDLEGNPIIYKDVKYVALDVGDTYIDRLVLESVSTHVKDRYSGQIVPITMKIWLPYSSTKQKDPAVR